MDVNGPGVRIRPAKQDDVPQIHAMVRELAEYEKEPDAVTATVPDFAAALFGPDPRAFCLVGELPDGALAGMALWFETFSTWTGRHGIWLEDLFVRPAHRGTGLGRLFLERLAAICVERGYRRLEWNVLDWNEPALGFYRRLGAQALDEWTVHRVSGDALHELARSSASRA
jgi:GNAT superfamily N-acetyltransferase